jgi:predicted  nucleic acid-binding Zn-ribbon protein
MPPPVNVERKNVEQKLDKVLNKLEQLEKHVRELEAQKAQLEKQVRVLRAQNVLRPQNQQSSRTPRREPAGSPDRID